MSKQSPYATAEDDSGSETIGLIVKQALSDCTKNLNGKWIVDSGATSHMCNCRDMFTELEVEVTLGDGSSLKAPGRGMVMVKSRLQNGKTYQCNLNDVLFVPSFAYNLISVAGVTKAGKLTEFTETECRILDGDKGVVATGCRMGSLYYLNKTLQASKLTWLIHKAEKTSGIDVLVI